MQEEPIFEEKTIKALRWIVEIFNRHNQIMEPRELAEYKKELNGEHQIQDIKAIENYLTNQKF